jgi:hypothetical protein
MATNPMELVMRTGTIMPMQPSGIYRDISREYVDAATRGVTGQVAAYTPSVPVTAPASAPVAGLGDWGDFGLSWNPFWAVVLGGAVAGVGSLAVVGKMLPGKSMLTQAAVSAATGAVAVALIYKALG